MPELTQGDKDFIKQLCNFAEQKATNGVYLAYFTSQSFAGQRYCVCIAIGEQADALQKIILGAQMPREGAIEIVSEQEAKAIISGEGESRW